MKQQIPSTKYQISPNAPIQNPKQADLVIEDSNLFGICNLGFGVLSFGYSITLTMSVFFPEPIDLKF
jgi:hypothetical protein